MASVSNHVSLTSAFKELLEPTDKQQKPLVNMVSDITLYTNDLVKRKAQSGLEDLITRTLNTYEYISTLQTQALLVLETFPTAGLSGKSVRTVVFKDAVTQKAELSSQLLRINQQMALLRTNLNNTACQLEYLQGKVGYFSSSLPDPKCTYFEAALKRHLENKLKEQTAENSVQTTQSDNTAEVESQTDPKPIIHVAPEANEAHSTEHTKEQTAENSVQTTQSDNAAEVERQTDPKPTTNAAPEANEAHSTEHTTGSLTQITVTGNAQADPKPATEDTPETLAATAASESISPKSEASSDDDGSVTHSDSAPTPPPARAREESIPSEEGAPSQETMVTVENGQNDLKRAADAASKAAYQKADTKPSEPEAAPVATGTPALKPLVPQRQQMAKETGKVRPPPPLPKTVASAPAEKKTPAVNNQKPPSST